MDILFLSPFPPSPPTFGAQRRMEGLMRALSARHRVSAITLANPDFDRDAAEAALRSYCDEVVVIPSRPDRGIPRRLLQVRSLLSRRSFEQRNFRVPAMQRALDGLLRRRAFGAVIVAFPFMSHYDLRQAPRGKPAPLVVVDQHNIEHDLARQSRDASQGRLRRLHHALNWKKLLREEVAAWTQADGVTFVSEEDASRARSLVPSIRDAVVSNGVDVAYFSPDPRLPQPDGRTALFCGTLGYFPNLDGVRYFLEEIWPRLERHPRARLKLVGPAPSPEVLARQGPRLDVAGLVPDLRPHLAQAAVTIVPLRVGGGTRFKILEAMAMGRPVVSTTIGAEGIAAEPGRDLLLADTAEDFAAAVARVLDDPDLAARLGRAGRALVERRYSWEALGRRMEGFLEDLRRSPSAAARPGR